MNKNRELLILVLFLIFILGVFLYINYSYYNDRKERKENRPLIIDSLFNDISLYGELIEIKKFKSGGRSTSLCCINIIISSVKSFYVFNQKMRIAFKIEDNLATMVGCYTDREKLKYIDINKKYPGLVTWYDDSLKVIRQIPLNSTFGIGLISEQDLKLCNHLIKD